MNDALVVEEALEDENNAMNDTMNATLAMNDTLVINEALEDENKAMNEANPGG